MNKSEAARLIASGIVRESFHHETLGHFDITALRELIERTKPEVHKCLFSAIQMVDGIECDALKYLCSHREIDEQRCRELTPEQLRVPLIFLDCPAVSNGEQESQLLVDGIHRIVELKRRGYENFFYYLIPLEEAPRVDSNICMNVPWGEKELVPGEGLVPRNKKED